MVSKGLLPLTLDELPGFLVLWWRYKMDNPNRKFVLKDHACTPWASGVAQDSMWVSQ